MVPTSVLSLLPLFAFAFAETPLSVYGCSGIGFTGHCETFTCRLEHCCPLPTFFKTSLVSVRSNGPWNFRLLTDAGCGRQCYGDQNNLFVDREGWRNIGAAAYSCINGPY